MYKVRILELKKEGKSHDEISKILGCAKSTVSFHCQNNGITRDSRKVGDEDIKLMKEMFKTMTTKEVANHFNVSVTTVKKYCGAKTKKPKYTTEEKKKKNSEAVARRRKKVKAMAVEYKGGKCQNPKCGYDRCNRALEFHHLDPNEKDFGIASKGHTIGWEKVKKELDKCIMVCGNCHCEIHDGLLNPEDFNIADWRSS